MPTEILQNSRKRSASSAQKSNETKVNDAVKILQSKSKEGWLSFDGSDGIGFFRGTERS